MKILAIRRTLQCGRTECVPPRKPPSAPSPGLPRKAISPPLAPPEGRAPHARNVGIATYRCISPLKPLVPLVRVLVSRRGGLRTPANEALLPPGDHPIRPPGVRLPPLIMLCLGLRPALQRGRTECVPPRKPPSALCQCFPR